MPEVVGLGTDLCEISRMVEALARHGDRFAEKVLGPQELVLFAARRARAPARGAAFLATRFAAKEALAKAAPAEAEMEYLVEELAPAVHQGRLLGGDGWLEAVRAQIERMVVRLRHSPILSEAVAAGRLRIVGACYDLDNGLVTVTRP